MTSTLTYTGELVILSCWCGIRHAVPSSLRAEALSNHLGALGRPTKDALWKRVGQGDGSRKPSETKRGGYQGSSDPGEPTMLMQPQTVPVGQSEATDSMVIAMLIGAE